MAESSVQPPMREQIADRKRIERLVKRVGRDLDRDVYHVTGQEADVRDLRLAVLALLSQPTPPAEPVSIADMAPFTNFTADTWPGAFPVRWRKEPDGWFSRIVTGGRSYFPEPEFDQSTIRDVTPPAATPEAGR